MNLEAHLHESERKLAHIWKAMALRGAVAIAFAVVILVWPSIGLTALIALFGAFALVSGLATIVGAFSVPMPGNRRAWLVVEGLLGVAVGVVVFVWPEPLGARAAVRHRRVGDRDRHLRDRALVQPPAQRPPVAAARAERTALDRVRRDHVREARRGSDRAARAHRGVRARDRRHADRVRARAAPRRRRARAPLPAARDGEARHARLEEESEMLTTLVAMSVGVLMVQAGIAKRQLAWRPRRTNRERRRRP